MQIGDIYLFYYGKSSTVFLVTKITEKTFYFIKPDGTTGIRKIENYKRAKLVDHYDNWKQAFKSKWLKKEKNLKGNKNDNFK